MTQEQFKEFELFLKSVSWDDGDMAVNCMQSGNGEQISYDSIQSCIDENPKLLSLFSQDRCEQLIATLMSGVCVEHYGGEGQGDDYYSVWKFLDIVTMKVFYINFYGWYASNYGSEYSGMNLVEPVQKMIIDYQTVNFK